jgi:cell division septum initiation protein DivIVA
MAMGKKGYEQERVSEFLDSLYAKGKVYQPEKGYVRASVRGPHMSSSAIPRTPKEAREFLEKLSTRVDHLFEDVVDVETKAEEHDDRIEELEAENEQLRQELEEVRTIAEQSMVIASAGRDPGSEPKVEHAKRLTRNELIRRVAIDAPSTDQPITASKVQEMAKPERELAYQSVKDGRGQLREEWPCFRGTKKNGARAITVSKSDVPKALTRAVEVDLDRDDLTKSIISGAGKGGGQR